jgi:alkylhydroperoxidase/carboxymuconolactone decarboxylase family protein YurZ
MTLCCVLHRSTTWLVPHLYKVMGSKPGYLEANWSKVKAVMVEPGKLDRLTKEIIAVAVSAVMGCEY